MTHSAGHHGEELGVDLYALWHAGRDNLPTVAGVYSRAANALDDATVGLPGAFRRTGDLAGAPYGPAYEPWLLLRDTIAKICRDTADNIEMTADVLCLATVEYARTDQEAANEFARLLQVNGEPKVGDQ